MSPGTIPQHQHKRVGIVCQYVFIVLRYLPWQDQWCRPTARYLGSAYTRPRENHSESSAGAELSLTGAVGLLVTDAAYLPPCPGASLPDLDQPGPFAELLAHLFPQGRQ